MDAWIGMVLVVSVARYGLLHYGLVASRALKAY